jgi:uncharacterized protein (DUF1499 family)
MTARLKKRESRIALWSRRIALFSAQLLIIGIILHHFSVLGSREVTNLLAVGIAFALLALVMAGVALLDVWRRGSLGAGLAGWAVFIALIILAAPLWYFPDLLLKPKINDIVTDPNAPLSFVEIAKLRPAEANTAQYPGQAFARQQLNAYPDIAPMTLERSREETYNLVRRTIAELGWDVVSEQEPTETEPGRIEAVAKTLIVGFPDDIAVVVSTARSESRIDMRSASRYGQHDFGANARRIRMFFRKVKTGLEEGEKKALEIALARRAKEKWKARKKQEKIELARRKAQRAKEDQERREELQRQAAAALRLQQQQSQGQQRPFVQRRTTQRRRSSRGRGRGFWSLFSR